MKKKKIIRFIKIAGALVFISLPLSYWAFFHLLPATHNDPHFATIGFHPPIQLVGASTTSGNGSYYTFQDIDNNVLGVKVQDSWNDNDVYDYYQIETVSQDNPYTHIIRGTAKDKAITALFEYAVNTQLSFAEQLVFKASIYLDNFYIARIIHSRATPQKKRSIGAFDVILSRKRTSK
jgi:hypothetical protein